MMVCVRLSTMTSTSTSLKGVSKIIHELTLTKRAMACLHVKVICGLFNKRQVKLMHAQNDFRDQTANGSPLTPMSTVHSKQTSSGVLVPVYTLT